MFTSLTRDFRTYLQLFCLLQMASLLLAVPPESCLVSQSCTSYCQSYGYGQGQCRTRILGGGGGGGSGGQLNPISPLISPLMVSPLSRYCQCSGCHGGYCRHYCHRVGRKYSGCMCFNFAQRVGLLAQRAGDFVGLANDCTNDVLYCQCSR